LTPELKIDYSQDEVFARLHDLEQPKAKSVQQSKFQRVPVKTIQPASYTMLTPIAYDVTRLVTRILNATPNGIDRLDLAYARHFLQGANKRNAAMMHFGYFGHNVLVPIRAANLLIQFMRTSVRCEGAMTPG
jgi:hypothetical protein